MYITGIDPTKVSENLNGAVYIPDFLPGSLGMDHEGKIYKYLKYNEGVGNVAAVVGQVAYYHTADGYKLYTATSDLSDSVQVGAGVIQAVMAEGQWGWFQIKGAATLSIALIGVGTDGDPLTPQGANDGTLDVADTATNAICATSGDFSDNEIICDFLM